MCELLGMSANIPTDICFSFAGLMRRGGHTGPHGDGWGIAFYEGKGCRIFHEASPSYRSATAAFVRGTSIKSRIVISHIRRANRGGVRLENTHPFVRELWGRSWTFAHNGQLRGIKKWPVALHRPVGTTDSEHAFCWLLDQLWAKWKKMPSPAALRSMIGRLARELAALGVFNMLLSDSRSLYCFRTTRMVYVTRRAPFGAATLIDDDLSVDFTEMTTHSDVVTIVASGPLTRDEVWSEIPLRSLVTIHDGELVGLPASGRVVAA